MSTPTPSSDPDHVISICRRRGIGGIMIKFLALALALSAPAAARAGWHGASSRHFVVYSDEKEEAVRAFAEKLERFDKALREFEGIQDEDLGPANRVTVYVVANDAEVRKLGRF